MMEKYITDERTGLKYELVGDYYLVVGDDEPEEDQPIGVWGQRHLRHLKRHHKVIYANLLTSGKLPEYLADIDRQAEELFLRLAKQTADAEGITEKLKASDQMEWVRQMNSIRNRAMEIVNAELIFAIYDQGRQGVPTLCRLFLYSQQLCKNIPSTAEAPKPDGEQENQYTAHNPEAANNNCTWEFNAKPYYCCKQRTRDVVFGPK